MSRYFKNYEDKYNPFLSSKKPVVVKAKINIDKEDIRLNVGNVKEIDSIVRKIAKDLSRKYGCIAFSSFNEIDLIIENPSKMLVKNKLETHNVVSLFSQEIFMRYNELNRSQKVSFVSVNTFNLFEDKVKSYLYNRQSVGFNNYVSTLSSKIFSYSQIKNKNKEELLSIIENISPSLKLIKKYIKDGFTSLNGIEIELHDIGDINKYNEYKVNTTEAQTIRISDDSVVEEEDI